MIWYETCGRSLAVALRLVGGPKANPPIGTMGGKRGYARVILGVLGLREGQGCDEVWMADPSEWGAVWPVIASPRAAEVAAILRSWKDREPRELWEECRAKGWGELQTAGEVAGWVLDASWSDPIRHGLMLPYVGGERPDPRPGHEGGILHPAALQAVAAKVEAVARWLVAAGWGWRAGEPESGFNAIVAGERANPTKIGNWATYGVETTPVIASRLHPWPVPLRCHHGSCLDVPVPRDASGFYVYADPSYRGTTGYAENVYAEDLRDYLMAWSEAGAIVAVSEARPLDELFPKWKTLRIDGERKGQKRTFSRQQGEWLTLNREPVWRPGVQQGLFGGTT